MTNKHATKSTDAKAESCSNGSAGRPANEKPNSCP